MTKKLIHKTLRYYILYSVLVLLASSVCFYLFIGNLYQEEIRESLWSREHDFLKHKLPKLHSSDIKTWNLFNDLQQIQEFDPRTIKTRSISRMEYDPVQHEQLPFQILYRKIKIDGNYYTLKTKSSLMESDDLIENIVYLFCILLVLLFTGLVLISRSISRKLWKPFYETLHQIEGFEIDRSTEPKFKANSILEFQKLNQSFEKLIHTNLKIFRKQREFVENAAHELQTPLAIFQNQLELLMQDEHLTEAQAEIIQKMELSVKRLNRLNKNLLLLSKLEQGNFPPKNLNLSQILNTSIDLFRHQFDHSKLNFKQNVESDVYVDANPLLLESLLNNLLSNCIKHNLEGGSIEITLNNKQVQLSNSGLKALDTEQLFERFQKTNSSADGNGLGLSIVKKIADLNQWQINYHFEKNMHYFELNFKNSKSIQN